MANSPKYSGIALYGEKKVNANGQLLDFTIIKVLFNGRSAEVCPRIATDLSLIQEGIWRILTTSRKERPYRRSFGCDLNRYLFEPLDDIFKQEVQDEVLRALSQQEPRIRVNSVSATKTGDYELSIALVYTVLLDRNYTVQGSVYIR